MTGRCALPTATSQDQVGLLKPYALPILVALLREAASKGP